MDVHLIIFSKKLGPPNQQVFRLRPSGALWQKCENSKFSEKTILVAVAGGGGDFGWNIDWTVLNSVFLMFHGSMMSF